MDEDLEDLDEDDQANRGPMGSMLYVEVSYMAEIDGKQERFALRDIVSKEEFPLKKLGSKGARDTCKASIDAVIDALVIGIKHRIAGIDHGEPHIHKEKE